MKNLTGLFVALLLTASLPVFAMQPTTAHIDTGTDTGKTLECTGRLVGFQSSLAPKTECNGAESCAHVAIYECPIWKDVKAVQCTSMPYDAADIARISALPLVNDYGDMDVILALEKEGIKQNDPKFMDIYKTRMAEKMTKRPAVKISGTLQGCNTCENCDPPATCSMTDCKMEILP